MKQTSGTAASKAAASRGPAGAVAPPHFIELISPNPGIDFLRWAPIAIAASWLFILAGLASIWWHGGLNYGIDFAGGTMVQVRFVEPASISDVRAALSQHDLKEVVVQDVGGSGREFQIRVIGGNEEADMANADAVKAGLRDRFGEGSYDVLRVETRRPARRQGPVAASDPGRAGRDGHDGGLHRVPLRCPLRCRCCRRPDPRRALHHRAPCRSPTWSST